MKTLFLITLLLISWITTPVVAQTSQPYAFSVTVTGHCQPMILIPGYSCSGEVWAETVAHLKNHYEWHVLTLPGYAGVSPIARPILQTVRDQIIRYLHDKHLDKPILMGHSLGAFMSLWVASEVPDQVGKLVCVDGVPFISALMDPNANADSLRKNPQFNPDAVAGFYARMPADGYEARMTKAMLAQVSDTTHARQIAHWSALIDMMGLLSVTVRLVVLVLYVVWMLFAWFVPGKRSLRREEDRLTGIMVNLRQQQMQLGSD